MGAMANSQNESRAHLWGILATFVAFVVGFAAVYALLAWLIVRYVWPQQGWWALPDFVRILEYALLGGAVTATAAAWIFIPSIRYNDPCDTGGLERYRRRWEAAHPRQNRMMRHVRRHGPWVVLVQVLLIPVALWLWTRPWRPRPTDMAPPADIAFGHVALCLLLAYVLHGVDEVASGLKRWKRVAVRARHYTMLMAIWPIVFLVGLFGGEALGWLLAR